MKKFVIMFLTTLFFTINIHAQTKKITFTNKVKVYDLNEKFKIVPNNMINVTIYDDRVELTNTQGKLVKKFLYKKINAPTGYVIYIQKEDKTYFTFDYTRGKAFLINDDKVKFEFDIDMQKSKSNKKTQTMEKINLKTSEISGVVRYHHNDHIGYKVDLGAEVIAIPKNDSLNINRSIIQLYEILAEKRMSHLIYEKMFEGTIVSDESVRNFSNFTHKDENELKELDGKVMLEYIKLLDLVSYKSLVDASGLYKLTIPYGEYFFIFISKNRDRPTLYEITGRKHIEFITVNKPQFIMSYDFGY